MTIPKKQARKQSSNIDHSGTTKQGLFYALQFRNFRLFFYGQLISVAGTWMQDVAQKWLVWEVTHSPTWLGVVSGANAIPFVVFAVWGGQIADRYSRRQILIWTQATAMLLAFVLALLASSFSPVKLEAWHIVVISALSGVVNAFNMPAQQAFVTDMVEDRKALGQRHCALNSLRFNLARVLGPIMAGVVLVKLGSASCFFLNGLSFIAVIISLHDDVPACFYAQGAERVGVRRLPLCPGHATVSCVSCC